jgi:hypothetical protein
MMIRCNVVSAVGPSSGLWLSRSSSLPLYVTMLPTHQRKTSGVTRPAWATTWQRMFLFDPEVFFVD